MKNIIVSFSIKQLLLVSLLSITFANATAEQTVGRDILQVFTEAHRGEELRAVAMGGSITQAGKGWVGPWLQQQFPNSKVSMHNAGMSGTGSNLGIFRLERDVIEYNPDLVFIEYAVNDGCGKVEDVIRWLESLVVRLKLLPQPPAIVFLEAAAQNGSSANATRG